MHGELTTCIIHVPFPLSTICLQLAVQVKELQNMLKVAESTIRQLHLDLQASHKELSILQDKDNLKIARDEMKITSLLSRITKFDSDLQLARLVSTTIWTPADICSHRTTVLMHYHVRVLGVAGRPTPISASSWRPVRRRYEPRSKSPGGSCR
jgi:hypothetical protein